jgi:hypothetical protein
MSIIADIADAVVAALNAAPAGTFDQVFTAQRTYLPQFDLKDMADLHVTVVPKGTEMALAGRGLAQSDVQIDLAVQKKLSAGAPDNTEIDALMGLVERIADFVRSTGTFGPALWLKTDNVPIYTPDHLRELGQFTSVLTLTLRVVKQ